MTQHQGESGHALPTLAALVAAAGAVVLGFGAANDSGAMAIIGGIAAGAGILAYGLAHHVVIDWELFRRTSK